MGLVSPMLAIALLAAPADAEAKKKRSMSSANETRVARSGQSGLVRWAADGEQSQKLARALAMSLHNTFVKAKSPIPINKVTVMEGGKMFMRLTRSGLKTLNEEPERFIAFSKHFVTVGKKSWPKVSLSLQRREGDVMVLATNDTVDGKTHVEIKSLTKPAIPTGKPKPPFSEKPVKRN
ncbi:MAG: hypothetical protein QF473_10710 [Planctomycetota bacterium]|jgi:hypothetical protein|nr:hypothetical protein [Planctomycetota bacterium]